MLSLQIGYFFRWTSLPTAAAFTVLLAFAVLPVWVLYRRDHSNDPDEPLLLAAALGAFGGAPGDITTGNRS